MKIITMFRNIFIIMAITAICIIPTTIVEATKTNTKKQSNKPYMDTELTKKEQKEFFKEYQKYDISEKNGILYYKDKPIRCFADIYRVVEIRHSSKYNGTIITCKSAYKYFNENGTVDIYVERTKSTHNGNPSFGNIIKKGNSLKDFIFVMPEDIIKKVVKILNRKGEYKKLVEIACFIDKNTIGKVAEKMVDKEKYKELLEIACFIDKNTIGKVAEKIADKGKYKELLEIACFVDKNTMDEIAKEMTDKGKYKEVLNMTWCISQNAANEIAKKMADKGKYKEILNMTWYISQDVVNEIAKKMAKKGKYEEIVEMAYLVSKDVLGEIAKKMAEEEEYEALKKIAFYIN